MKSTQPIIIGIFFLIWATSAYLVLGNVGKYLSLFTGFLFIVIPVFKQKIKKNELFFLMKIIFFFLLFLSIAYINLQRTLNVQNLAFALVCFLLLFAGYRLGKEEQPLVNVHTKWIILFAILVIIGSYKFYQIQVILLVSSALGRDLGDEALNAVGVAYVNGLTFLFLFWLYFNNTNRYIRLLIIIAATATLYIMISTLSRGAILYLIVFLFLFYLPKIRRIRLNFTVLKSLIFITIALVMLYYFIGDSPIIIQKINSITYRFESLLSYFENDTVDPSTEERTEGYSMVIDNWTNSLFGTFGYRPYPHNQFLEIFSRWGIFGIPLIIFSIMLLWKSIRIIRFNWFNKKSIAFLIIPLFFFSYLQSMSSLSLEMNRMLWFGFGYIYANWNIRKNYSKETLL